MKITGNSHNTFETTSSDKKDVKITSKTISNHIYSPDVAGKIQQAVASGDIGLDQVRTAYENRVSGSMYDVEKGIGLQNLHAARIGKAEYYQKHRVRRVVARFFGSDSLSKAEKKAAIFEGKAEKARFDELLKSVDVTGDFRQFLLGKTTKFECPEPTQLLKKHSIFFLIRYRLQKGVPEVQSHREGSLELHKSLKGVLERDFMPDPQGGILSDKDGVDTQPLIDAEKALIRKFSVDVERVSFANSVEAFKSDFRMEFKADFASVLTGGIDASEKQKTFIANADRGVIQALINEVIKGITSHGAPVESIYKAWKATEGSLKDVLGEFSEKLKTAFLKAAASRADSRGSALGNYFHTAANNYIHDLELVLHRVTQMPKLEVKQFAEGVVTDPKLYAKEIPADIKQQIDGLVDKICEFTGAQRDKAGERTKFIGWLKDEINSTKSQIARLLSSEELDRLENHLYQIAYADNKAGDFVGSQDEAEYTELMKEVGGLRAQVVEMLKEEVVEELPGSTRGSRAPSPTPSSASSVESERTVDLTDDEDANIEALLIGQDMRIGSFSTLWHPENLGIERGLNKFIAEIKQITKIANGMDLSALSKGELMCVRFNLQAMLHDYRFVPPRNVDDLESDPIIIKKHWNDHVVDRFEIYEGAKEYGKKYKELVRALNGLAAAYEKALEQ